MLPSIRNRSSDENNFQAAFAKARHVVVRCVDHVDVHCGCRDDLRDFRLIS